MDRYGARTIGPASYLLCAHGGAALVAALAALATTPHGFGESFAPRNLVTVVGHGLLGVTGTGMQTSALTLAPAAYVNAIRRMSAVLAVLLGRTLFAEPDLARRLTAGSVWINDVLFSHAAPQAPWGGPGDSGDGRTHGDAGILSCRCPARN